MLENDTILNFDIVIWMVHIVAWCSQCSEYSVMIHWFVPGMVIKHTVNGFTEPEMA